MWATMSPGSYNKRDMGFVWQGEIVIKEIPGHIMGNMYLHN